MEAHEKEHDSTHKRVNRGYKLREDLIKACKRVALETDRTLYAVMEEALEEYLKRKHETISRGNYASSPPSLRHAESSSKHEPPEPPPDGTPFPEI
jgi:hypothetical protein